MARKTVDQNISYDSEKKRYYVTLHCGSDERGNRLRKTRCFPTLEQARLVRDNFQRNRTLRTQILPAGVTVGQWLDYWLEVVIRPHRAVTTTYGYQKIIDNHLKPALGKIPLHELTAVQVQQYLFRQLEEGLSNNTARKHHTLLSTALGLAVRQDMHHILTAQVALVDAAGGDPNIPFRRADGKVSAGGGRHTVLINALHHNDELVGRMK